MGHSLKILFAVAEASPLVKVGGLGDVAGSLPATLRRSGHDVRIIMPRYRSIDLAGYQCNDCGNFFISFLENQERVAINEVVLQDGTPVYLVENESYFDRPAVYGEADDLERFLFFSRAVMEVPKRLDWQPDVLHSHDWHMGAIPALLKVAYRDDTFYSSCASVYTIHNMGYQGWFDDSFAGRAGLYEYLPPSEDPIHSKSYSMMALGINHSDIISTVSKTYAAEILTPEYGMGLDELLQRRQDSLFGILNGIDYDQYNPANDRLIAANYDSETLDKKVKNKLALQDKAGLPVDAGTPLLGLAARLVDQKGIDILADALDSLLNEANVQFVLQGTGDSKHENILKMLESKYPDKARVFLVLDFSLARLIFAGSDMYLTPSRFEPCGLSHLIAMRYGAIPIVRHTGGLAETVPDCVSDLSSGLGFVFERYDAGELLMTLRRALVAWQHENGWHQLMRRVVRSDFSWKSALSQYEALYEMAIRKSTVS
ncbi:MAG: glycogen/starch synthase [Chloroflexota bacterium]|nr:glycogen/starch synthase [Chloroflexota bacterium]